MTRESILITGSSKGLGRELALVFADNGFNTILHGRNANALKSLRRTILQKGRSCKIVRGDIRTAGTITRLFNTAAEADVSVLINNAVLKCPHLPLEKMDDRKIVEILETNLIAPIKLTRRLYGLFCNNGRGTIININSLSGLEPQYLRSIYCASKWGLRGFTNSFRIEAEKHNVRIIGVYPSTIKIGPKITYGMEPAWVARKIYAAYRNQKCAGLKLDNRPNKKRWSEGLCELH